MHASYVPAGRLLRRLILGVLARFVSGRTKALGTVGYGVLVIIGAIFFIFAEPTRTKKFIEMITLYELSEDPKDFNVNHLLQNTHTYSVSSQIFSIIFLASHGVIKIVLVYALLKKKMWAFPVAISVFSLFLIYQLYRFSITNSFGILLLSIFDIIVIALTYREYKKIRREQGQKNI